AVLRGDRGPEFCDLRIPRDLRLDAGPRLTARAYRSWPSMHGVDVHEAVCKLPVAVATVDLAAASVSPAVAGVALEELLTLECFRAVVRAHRSLARLQAALDAIEMLLAHARRVANRLPLARRLGEPPRVEPVFVDLRRVSDHLANDHVV